MLDGPVVLCYDPPMTALILTLTAMWIMLGLLTFWIWVPLGMLIGIGWFGGFVIYSVFYWIIVLRLG